MNLDIVIIGIMFYITFIFCIIWALYVYPIHQFSMESQRELEKKKIELEILKLRGKK